MKGRQAFGTLQEEENFTLKICFHAFIYINNILHNIVITLTTTSALSIHAGHRVQSITTYT